MPWMGAANTASSVDPFAILFEYEQASRAHAPGRPELIEEVGHWRGIGFRLGALRLLVGFEHVVEIISMPPLTPVPGSAPWMLGVANVRGTLLPVVDLKQFLQGERTVLHESTRALVVRQSGGDVAVLMDEMFGQRTFSATQVAEGERFAGGRYESLIERVYRAGDTVWGVLDMGLLTRTPEFRQASV